ncbi:MAG: CPBP family intramembrane metalloprotease [Paludibacter sp.]|nr:CPBP family intramembrane metalloprotease [Paludibacter sp.]
MNRFKGILEQSGLFSNLVVLFAFICFFVLLLSPLTALMAVTNPPSVNFLKLSQLVLSTAVFILPPFALAYLCSKSPVAYLYFDTKTRIPDAGFVILFMLIIIPFVNLLGDINHHLVLPGFLSGVENWMKSAEDEANKLVEQMLQVHGYTALFFNIFLIALLPAIGEELFFRGALIRIFQQWKGIKTAIWIAAFIFSTIHLQFYGFVPRLLMGAFFGYLLLWSGNLWLPIIAHFINNVVAVIFYYLKYNGYKMPDIDSIGYGNTLWIGIASGALGIFLIYRLRVIFRLRADKIINS